VTFAIRTITRSVTGADIVHRPQLLEKDAVEVGRSTSCDICLPDLAVSLRHATISQTGPDKILVEAIGAEPFQVAGTFKTRAELSLSETPKLSFGSYDLALSASAEDSSILVDVTCRESEPEAAADTNERRIFSVASSTLGKRPVAWALAAVAILACLAWPIVSFMSHANRTIHADQQWSTGPLSKAHAFLGKNCQACHVKAFVSVRDETCLACHRSTSNPEAARLVAANEQNWGGPKSVSLIREHAAHDRLLRAAPLPKDFVGQVKVVFQRQFDHNTDRCASCHLEHLADTPPKAAPGAAVAAPIPRVIPVLHETDDCASCHARLRRSLGSTALRDTPDWTHHPEFRPLIARTPIGQSPPKFDRISLVQQPTDYTGLIFSHQEHLSTSGGVARMAAGLGHADGALVCADCHRPNSSGKGFLPVEMTRDCASCHSLAYAPGAGGSPRLLPHGHPDQVVAALRAYYGGGGSSAADGAARQPPGFLAQLGMRFGGHADSSAAAVKIRALFAPKGLCAECHVVVPPTDTASLDYKIRPIQMTDRYLPRGDFNHDIPAHKRDAAGRPTCDTCHKASESANADELLLPRLSQCASCHGKTKDVIATAAPGDCTECHSFHAPGMATKKSDHMAPAPPATAWNSAADIKTLAAFDARRRTF
jgi:hypothetical protein